MIFYIENECFCINKKDNDLYKSTIIKTLSLNKDISIDENGYVVLSLNDSQKILYSFSFSSITNYNEQDLANWFLYVYDMCHSHVSKLIDPHNKQRRSMPHMNSVKDIMYNSINKMIYENELDISHLIFNLITKLNESKPYDFYSNQANYLFYKFLLKWFNLSNLGSSLQIFNKIVDKSISFISFKNTIFYEFLIKYKNIIFKNSRISCQAKNEFDFNQLEVNYKNTNLRTWFDNSKISLLIIQIINSNDFLEDIESIN